MALLRAPALMAVDLKHQTGHRFFDARDGRTPPRLDREECHSEFRGQFQIGGAIDSSKKQLPIRISKAKQRFLIAEKNASKRGGRRRRRIVGHEMKDPARSRKLSNGPVYA